MCGIVLAARPIHNFTATEDYEDIKIRHREVNAARGSFNSTDVLVDLSEAENPHD